jgi:hypothetical protein
MESSMMRHLVAKGLLAAALTVGAACSSGDGAPNEGSGGSASGGTTAGGGGTAGAATGGQRTGGAGGIAGTGGTPEPTAGRSGAGGAATGGHPSGGRGGSALTGTGGGGSSGAAATGGSTTGGTGGTVAYAPCPTNGSACKILPFGDSITRGAKSTDDGGYRSPLFKLIVAAKQKATFVGSAANGPTQVSGQPFPRMHEGHAGWTIDPGYNMLSSSYSGISKLVPSPALDANPNIILLMIGTNDLFAMDTAGMATRLEALLDKIAQNAPNALIVLAQLTPLGHDDPNLTAYNAKIPGIVQSHAAKGQRIIGVDMSKLPTSELTDGTHPTDQGYAYMANIWYAAIKDLLPK